VQSDQSNRKINGEFVMPMSGESLCIGVNIGRSDGFLDGVHVLGLIPGLIPSSGKKNFSLVSPSSISDYSVKNVHP